MLIIISSQKQEPLAVCESDAGGTVYVEKDDNAAIRRLKDEAVAYDLAANDGHRLECYLILNDSTTLWLLQTVGLPEEIEEKELVTGWLSDVAGRKVTVATPQKGKKEKLVDDSYYLDGGFFNNSPVDMLDKIGCDKIYVIGIIRRWSPC